MLATICAGVIDLITLRISEMVSGLGNGHSEQSFRSQFYCLEWPCWNVSKRFSNTHIFYKSGWRGINIEPNPAALMSFTRERKGDINLQFGVASERGDLLYYEFDDPALNTFDKKLAEERESTTSYRLIATQRIRIDRLDALLEAHVPQGVTIDFLTVDVEGMDLDVLKSNNWNKFRPRCVLTEILDTPLTIESLAGSPTIVYLQQQGYRLLAKTYNSFFFLDDRVDQIGRTNI